MNRSIILRLNSRNNYLIAIISSIFLMVLIFSLFLFYKLGIKDGEYYRELSIDLAKKINTMQLDLDNLRKAKILADKNSEIASISLEDSRLSLLTLKQEIDDLESDIFFYRSLMKPETTSPSIVIHDFNLSFNQSSNFYRYSVVIAQVASQHNLINGELNIFLEYVKDSKILKIPIENLSSSQKSVSIPLEFRFFQEINGKFYLPENIKPTGILLNFQSSGKIKKNIIKSFSWLPLLGVK